MAAGNRIGAQRGGCEQVGCGGTVAGGVGEPGRAGSNTARLLGRPVVFCVAQAVGVHHQTVQRCVERALAYGPAAALDDRPRPGKEPTITAAAKAAMDEFNRHPVVHTWSYKLDKAA